MPHLVRHPQEPASTKSPLRRGTFRGSPGVPSPLVGEGQDEGLWSSTALCLRPSVPSAPVSPRPTWRGLERNAGGSGVGPLQSRIAQDVSTPLDMTLSLGPARVQRTALRRSGPEGESEPYSCVPAGPPDGSRRPSSRQKAQRLLSLNTPRPPRPIIAPNWKNTGSGMGTAST